MSNEEQQRYLDNITVKAETLIEALPYIRDFNSKKVVVKYGGSAMLDHNLEESVIKDVALLKLVGMQPIIVHGGGKEISKWISNVGKETRFEEGFRVTDKDTMEIAEMVLNRVNKNLVSMVEHLGVKAIGLCGKDGGMLHVQKKMPNGKDIGFVGDIDHVNTEVIDTLLENDYIPIIAPIGMDDEGNTYNINADDAACAIAGGIRAEKLAFLTDVEGVCMNPNDPTTLVSSESDRSQQINRSRHYQRRYAAKGQQLYSRCKFRRWQSAYFGWKTRSLLTLGVLYKTRYRYGDHW